MMLTFGKPITRNFAELDLGWLVINVVLSVTEIFAAEVLMSADVLYCQMPMTVREKL